MPDEIKLDKYMAVIDACSKGWQGQVVLRSEYDYGGTPEWTLTGQDKSTVVHETIDALISYEKGE
jgi:hypothetical protein